MELVILSPRHKQTETIVWLEIQTPSGEFVIKNGHAPMIINLLPDYPFTFMLDNGIQKSVHSRRAMVSILRNQITIFMDEHE